MFNYIRAEVYRVLHKKSLYIYFGCIAVGYTLLTLISAGAANETSVGRDAANLFFLLPAVVGGYLFATLLGDDLSSKNLTTLIGFGMNKAKIVVSKLLLVAGLSAVILGITPLFMAGIYAVIGHSPSTASLEGAYTESFSMWLTLIACTAIASIATYGLQRVTFAMVLYLLLALRVIDQLLSMVFSWNLIRDLAPNLSDYLVTSITSRIQLGATLDGTMLAAIIEYGVVLVVATVLSVIVFNKKESEF
ncbi:MAG: hypothetical protein LBG75_01725 [Candidatus Nomurabacteria bacterium]|jgi:ABC-type transport system involved in multi-copper enzyme maturation permease subunit|nr:hypothetical protein [Candidatus Nomurabacteria bacterium]